MRALTMMIAGLFASQAAFAASIQENIASLKNYFDGGHHFELEGEASGDDLESMLRDYLVQVEHENHEIKLLPGDMILDKPVLGLLSARVALQEVLNALDFRCEYIDTACSADDLKQDKLKMVRIMIELYVEGAVFGFDGFWQNFCAAPTSNLLILDQEARKVHLVDLTPCQEG